MNLPKWVTIAVSLWGFIGTALIAAGLKSVFGVSTEFIFSQEFIDTTLIAIGAVLNYLAYLKSKVQAQVSILSLKSKLAFILNPVQVNVG